MAFSLRDPGSRPKSVTVSSKQGPIDAVLHKGLDVAVLGGIAKVVVGAGTTDAWLSVFDPLTGEHLATTEGLGSFHPIEPLGG